MSWGEIFLGVIAVSSLATALTLIAVLVYAWTLATRAMRILERVERDLKPLLESLNSVARAASVAALQVERIDELILTLTGRIDQTAAAVQSAIVTPLREGAAVIAGIRAVLAALKPSKQNAEKPPTADEDAPLFIG